MPVAEELTAKPKEFTESNKAANKHLKVAAREILSNIILSGKENKHFIPESYLFEKEITEA